MCKRTCRLKDPLPYMAKYPEADILTSSDHLVRLRCTQPKFIPAFLLNILDPQASDCCGGTCLPECLPALSLTRYRPKVVVKDSVGALLGQVPAWQQVVCGCCTPLVNSKMLRQHLLGLVCEMRAHRSCAMPFDA